MMTWIRRLWGVLRAWYRDLFSGEDAALREALSKPVIGLLEWERAYRLSLAPPRSAAELPVVALEPEPIRPCDGDFIQMFELVAEVDYASDLSTSLQRIHFQYLAAVDRLPDNLIQPPVYLRLRGLSPTRKMSNPELLGRLRGRHSRPATPRETLTLFQDQGRNLPSGYYHALGVTMPVAAWNNKPCYPYIALSRDRGKGLSLSAFLVGEREVWEANQADSPMPDIIVVVVEPPLIE